MKLNEKSLVCYVIGVIFLVLGWVLFVVTSNKEPVLIGMFAFSLCWIQGIRYDLHIEEEKK